MVPNLNKGITTWTKDTKTWIKSGKLHLLMNTVNAFILSVYRLTVIRIITYQLSRHQQWDYPHRGDGSFSSSSSSAEQINDLSCSSYRCSSPQIWATARTVNHLTINPCCCAFCSSTKHAKKTICQYHYHLHPVMQYFQLLRYFLLLFGYTRMGATVAYGNGEVVPQRETFLFNKSFTGRLTPKHSAANFWAI